MRPKKLIIDGIEVIQKVECRNMKWTDTIKYAEDNNLTILNWVQIPKAWETVRNNADFKELKKEMLEYWIRCEYDDTLLRWDFMIRERPNLYSGEGPWDGDPNGGVLLGRKIVKRRLK